MTSCPASSTTLQHRRRRPLPALFLSHGVTSLRDPASGSRRTTRRAPPPAPRLFLTGPHLDSPPAAYPADSHVVRDARRRASPSAVSRAGRLRLQGLLPTPVGLSRRLRRGAPRGLPVTSHLESLTRPTPSARALMASSTSPPSARPCSRRATRRSTGRPCSPTTPRGARGATRSGAGPTSTAPALSLSSHCWPSAARICRRRSPSSSGARATRTRRTFMSGASKRCSNSPVARGARASASSSFTLGRAEGRARLGYQRELELLVGRMTRCNNRRRHLGERALLPRRERLGASSRETRRPAARRGRPAQDIRVMRNVRASCSAARGSARAGSEE